MELKKIYNDEGSSIELSRNQSGKYSYCLKVKTYGENSNDKAMTKLTLLKGKVDSFIIQQTGGR